MHNEHFLLLRPIEKKTSGTREIQIITYAQQKIVLLSRCAVFQWPSMDKSNVWKQMVQFHYLPTMANRTSPICQNFTPLLGTGVVLTRVGTHMSSAGRNRSRHSSVCFRPYLTIVAKQHYKNSCLFPGEQAREHRTFVWGALPSWHCAHVNNLIRLYCTIHPKTICTKNTFLVKLQRQK